MRARLHTIIRIAAIAVVGMCLWLFTRDVDWGRLGDELRHAKLAPLLAAGVLNYVLLIGKAVCWRIMLAPRYAVPTLRLVRYTIVAFGASVLAPARAGELLRVWLLNKRDRVPVADVAAVAIAEKLLDAVSILILVAPLPWLLPRLESWVTTSILVCAAIAVTAFIGLYIAVGRIKAPGSWFGRFIAGMHVLRSGRRLIGSFAALFAVWSADLAMICLVGSAVGIALPIPAALLILFTLNLAITAPSTPGGIGALQVGVLAATRLLGIADEPAFALALLYHSLQIVPLVVIGLALEWRLVLGRTRHEVGVSG